MRTFTFSINRSIYMVPLDDIVYMENELRKIRIHLANCEYVFYGTFRKVLEQLDGRFLPVSRSFILNRDRIRSMGLRGQYEIIMDDGSRIPIGKNIYYRVRTDLKTRPKPL